MQWYWRRRAEWTPEAWSCQMAGLVDGDVVGSIDLTARDFPVMGTVSTGSWLGRAHQGQGLGTEMRRLALALAFDGLGAAHACSSAWHDNVPSLGVPRRLGYRGTGRARSLRRDRADVEVQLELSRGNWLAQGHADVAIAGLGPCLDLFGVATPREEEVGASPA